MALYRCRLYSVIDYWSSQPEPTTARQGDVTSMDVAAPVLKGVAAQTHFNGDKSYNPLHFHPADILVTFEYCF